MRYVAARQGGAGLLACLLVYLLDWGEGEAACAAVGVPGLVCRWECALHVLHGWVSVGGGPGEAGQGEDNTVRLTQSLHSSIR
jgi:hypothetical protein